jgi:hypothetical protein
MVIAVAEVFRSGGGVDSEVSKKKSDPKPAGIATRNRGGNLTPQRGGFETIVTNSDVSIIATGRDLAACFANAARGMYSVITDGKITQHVESR